MELSLVPGVVGIHHVGLAVRDLDAALALWTGLLGARVELRAVVEAQGVEAACVMWDEAAREAAGPLAHGTVLELVAPASPDSPFVATLDKRGEGLHHVAWEVIDVAVALDSLARAGARVIDAVPRPGLHGTPVAFVHPASAGGLLVELVESPRASS